MHLITNYQYHVAGKCWNFFVNGMTPSQLINASLYTDQHNQYKYREPFVNEDRQRFVLLGDGNLETTIDGLHHEYAYKIIQNAETFQTYVILSSSFTSEFELIKNNI